MTSTSHPIAERRRESFYLRRLLGFALPYRWYLAAALLAVLVSSGLGLAYPLVMGRVVDTSLEQAARDPSSLNRLGLLLVGLFAAQAIFDYIRIYFLSAMGEGVVADLRRTTYSHLMTLPVQFFDGRRTGEITSRLTSDAAVVQTTVSVSLATAVQQGVTLVGGLILVFVISIQLAVTVLSFLPIAIIGAGVFGRYLRRVSTEFQDLVAEANAAAEESIAAIRVVKWFSAEPSARRRYARAIDTSYRAALRRARLRALFTPFVTFVAFGTLAVVLWRGGRLVLDGRLSAGELVTFLLYTLIVANSIGAFTGLYAQIQVAVGASRRIFDLLEERSDLLEPTTPLAVGTITGRISFEGVWFRYPDREIDVLRGIDVEVPAGEILALVGPSGAGKSTMVQLIPRFFDPTRGSVSFDGVDLRDMTISQVRGFLAAVPQETQLFSGSVADNLLVGDPDASAEQLMTAAKAAHVHEFISKFPEGYETIVGERGIKLSGGQRQRVAIARALLKDPTILILDEATSSLDSESEALVQDALQTLMSGRTTVVIAHRLSTVRVAHRIVVIDEGRITEAGTHDELLAAGGLYRDLYDLQFRDQEVAD